MLHGVEADGAARNGITHGIMAGLLLTDMIMGRRNPWEKVYDPSRITLKAAPEFLKENLDVALQYAHYALPGEKLFVAGVLG